ncbi:helix-turn-helix transcriptional regulator [Allobranchiibius sp. GilTou38]|uniref:helix-turn-helix domain-containing protein n=1 Tax=Allobranchiibius sp. GilTou38 TaxID=2815210 RepID=UPI001AA12D8E|nr:helix-turn-helix transcriptional regulator [Allobranchiibius sp. GilTou38]MBO1767051.1 helix-turn-helix transcriptional regulator [Allobranchiibius sp. GilTou38]
MGKIEERIGANVRQAREALGISQSDLGVDMEGLLGKSWTRQAVSAAEAGGRAFAAAEVVALATALLIKPADLFEPRLDTDPGDVVNEVIARGARSAVSVAAVQQRYQSEVREFARELADEHASLLPAFSDALAELEQKHADGLGHKDELKFAHDVNVRLEKTRKSDG